VCTKNPVLLVFEYIIFLLGEKGDVKEEEIELQQD
jgi:hypothetical protein